MTASTNRSKDNKRKMFFSYDWAHIWPLPPLKVQALWGPFLFFIEHILFGLLEVLICYFHPPLPEGHKPCFCANRLTKKQQVFISPHGSVKIDYTDYVHSLHLHYNFYN